MYFYNTHRRRDCQLTLSYRLCKLFACHVSSPFGVLSWVRVLTVSTSRLNSRDYVRDRSTTDNPENAINLSSIRIDPLSEAYRSKSGQTGGVTVTVHHSAKSDFSREKADLDVEPTYEIRKTV